MKKQVFFALVTTAVTGFLGSPSRASAQSVSERLGIHGYMTQAYGNATEYPIFGIPTAGTTDYRAAALQFRYAVTGADALVLQFSHRRLGVSAFSTIEDDVALDWGFYQRRIAGGSVRVGKIPMHPSTWWRPRSHGPEGNGGSPWSSRSRAPVKDHDCQP